MFKSTNTSGKRRSSPAGTAAAKRARKATRSKASKGSRAGNGDAVIGPEERRRLIELAAYRRFEQRGFNAGSAEQDWVEAEAEVDRMLAGTPESH
jgi:hypothetical protein